MEAQKTEKWAALPQWSSEERAIQFSNRKSNHEHQIGCKLYIIYINFYVAQSFTSANEQIFFLNIIFEGIFNLIFHKITFLLLKSHKRFIILQHFADFCMRAIQNFSTFWAWWFMLQSSHLLSLKAIIKFKVDANCL